MITWLFGDLFYYVINCWVYWFRCDVLKNLVCMFKIYWRSNI